MSKPRIVSLLPACTEIVCALGREDSLVGRSHECDFPASVKSLPACTAPRFDVGQSSAQIDGRVKALLGQSAALYSVNMDLLRQLHPDIILTQAQCEVCAISLSELESALSTWTEGAEKPEIVSVSPDRLADLWANLREIAIALGVPDEGKSVIKTLKNRVADIIMKTCQFEQRPTVACIEWLEPMMAAGNWVPELVELAGGRNLFGESGKHSDWLPWKQVVERDPEVILLMPCGFDIQRTRRERAVLTELPSWPRLRAVRDQRVHIVDANQYFNRPGPRLVDSLEILAEILHPNIFRVHYEPLGWQRF